MHASIRWLDFKTIVIVLVLLRTFLFVAFVINDGRYMEADSFGYVALAENLLEQHKFLNTGTGIAEPEVFRTPGYPFFLAVIKSFGSEHPWYWAAGVQELIYLLTAFLFFHMGKQVLGEKLSRLGMLYMLLEPGGLAFPKLLLSETLFLPFFIAGLLCVGLYFKTDKLRLLLWGGFLFGVGALVRPAILYFPLVVVFTNTIRNYRFSKNWLDSSAFLLIFILIISPWLVRNYIEFGKLFMTGQQSNMFANYHVPMVLESALDIPFWQGQAMIKERVENSVIEKERILKRPLSKVEFFALQQEIANHELMKYPGFYVRQWLFGILKTMNGTSLTELYHGFRYQESRLHYFEIEATSFFQRVYIFITNQDIPVMIMVLFRVIVSGFALLGCFVVIEKKNPFLWLMLAANFYFIFIPGPMGYSRFRFPVEVFWFIQAVLGYLWCLIHMEHIKNRMLRKKSIRMSQNG